MKYLKSLRRICVFLFLISVFFVLSKATVFSATCKTSSGSTGLCETTCTSGSQEDTSGTADCDYGTGVVFKCCVLNPSGGNGKCTDQSATSSQALCSTKCDDGQFIGKFDCSEGMFCCKKTPTTTSSSSSSTSASLNYTPLENLPGFEGQSGDFASYFGSLYKFALWIVGISALFMLVVGGFLYLSSAGNTSLVGSAKKTISGALIGLIIALISWLLLDTINSDLTNLKLSGLSGTSGTDGGSSTSSPVGGSAGKVLEEAYKMVALSDQKKCEYSQQVPRNGCDQGKSYPHTDCSDFTVSAYKRAGCSAPPDGTSNMVSAAEAIGDKSSLKPGDAIVYNNGSHGHVVICENNGCSTYTAAASTKNDLVKGRDSGHMFKESGLKVLRVSKYCKDS